MHRLASYEHLHTYKDKKAKFFMNYGEIHYANSDLLCYGLKKSWNNNFVQSETLLPVLQ